MKRIIYPFFTMFLLGVFFVTPSFAADQKKEKKEKQEKPSVTFASEEERRALEKKLKAPSAPAIPGSYQAPQPPKIYSSKDYTASAYVPAVPKVPQIPVVPKVQAPPTAPVIPTPPHIAQNPNTGLAVPVPPQAAPEPPKTKEEMEEQQKEQKQQPKKKNQGIKPTLSDRKNQIADAVGEASKKKS